MRMRSSAMADYKRCQAFGYYKYELGLVPKGSGSTGNINTAFGTLVHKAVQVLETDGKEAAEDVITASKLPPGKYKTKSTARILLEEYRKKTANLYKVVETEKAFTFRIGRHEWAGRYDIVAEGRNGLFIIDLKTTDPYHLILKPNDQFIAYCIGGFLDYDAKGISIISLDPMTLQVSLMPIHYSASEKGEWLKQTSDFLALVEGALVWRNPNFCLYYERQCPYIPLCKDGIKPDRLFTVSEEQKGMIW